MPKDTGSITRSDARNIAKEAFFDVLNAPDEKLVNSKYNLDLRL